MHLNILHSLPVAQGTLLTGANSENYKQGQNNSRFILSQITKVDGIASCFDIFGI